ncbi:MAG TPA: Spy/CpxP family protein refolding chaperone [Candidatus Paceibacterota bacterium]|nr:Spy/CpxP family protein refolding chaperone [Verrucomicrobiota bacterium]HRY50252.1 Spy/CpxP family protein refolding chaperone [Candidatus Paceibacterota bacterium]HRZ99205.1 Spy/CpxP family protein refolding chaperone [Candidatus Paceibacterota bacterium]
MKTKIILTHMLVTVCLLCAAAIQAVAQQQGPGGILTQEQRTKMRETMQASQTDLAPLTSKLAEAQKDAIKAALVKDADPKVVRAKLEAVAKIQTDIAMLRFKAVKELAPTLTDEQKTQMDERPGSAYNSLFGSMGGGARRSGGGGGGGN